MSIINKNKSEQESLNLMINSLFNKRYKHFCSLTDMKNKLNQSVHSFGKARRVDDTKQKYRIEVTVGDYFSLISSDYKKYSVWKNVSTSKDDFLKNHLDTFSSDLSLSEENILDSKYIKVVDDLHGCQIIKDTGLDTYGLMIGGQLTIPPVNGKVVFLNKSLVLIGSRNNALAPMVLYNIVTGNTLQLSGGAMILAFSNECVVYYYHGIAYALDCKTFECIKCFKNYTTLGVVDMSNLGGTVFMIPKHNLHNLFVDDQTSNVSEYFLTYENGMLMVYDSKFNQIYEYKFDGIEKYIISDDKLIIVSKNGSEGVVTLVDLTNGKDEIFFKDVLNEIEVINHNGTTVILLFTNNTFNIYIAYPNTEFFKCYERVSSQSIMEKLTDISINNNYLVVTYDDCTVTNVIAIDFSKSKTTFLKHFDKSNKIRGKLCSSNDLLLFEQADHNNQIIYDLNNKVYLFEKEINSLLNHSNLKLIGNYIYGNRKLEKNKDSEGLIFYYQELTNEVELNNVCTCKAHSCDIAHSSSLDAIFVQNCNGRGDHKFIIEGVLCDSHKIIVTKKESQLLFINVNAIHCTKYNECVYISYGNVLQTLDEFIACNTVGVCETSIKYLKNMEIKDKITELLSK